MYTVGHANTASLLIRTPHYILHFTIVNNQQWTNSMKCYQMYMKSVHVFRLQSSNLQEDLSVDELTEQPN